MSSLHLEIKRLRRAAGLSQSQLAVRSGVTRQTIIKLEKECSEGTTTSTLEKIARGLDFVNYDAMIRTINSEAPADV